MPSYEQRCYDRPVRVDLFVNILREPQWKWWVEKGDGLQIKNWHEEGGTDE